MKRIKLIIYSIFILIGIASTVLASSNNATPDTSFIGYWINTILLAIGLILLGWYQKYQIGILRREIESQKSIIASLKQYSDIIDVNKIKDFVRLSEATIEKRKEIEIADLQSKLSEKIKSIEFEKDELITKISKSSEEIDKIKIDYIALAKNSSERIVLFQRYRILVQQFETLSLIKDRLLLYVSALLLLNKIKEDKFYDITNEVSQLSDFFHDTLKLVDDTNLSEVEEELKVPEVLSNIDSNKFSLAYNKLSDSLDYEIEQTISKIKASR